VFLIYVLAASSILAADPLDQWHLRESPPDTYFTAVAYGNGKFVAVGARGLAGTSPDGTTWTFQGLVGFGRPLQAAAIAYGNGTFVALAEPEGTLISRDGLVRTEGGPASVGVGSAGAITYGNGLFAAVCPPFKGVLTSPDGVEWAYRSLDLGNQANPCNIVFGDGRFVAIGPDNNQNPVRIPAYVVVSSDGTNWVRHDLPDDLPGGCVRVTYGNGRYVAGFHQGTTITSTNAIDWIVHPGITLGSDQELDHLAYGNGRFVAVVGPYRFAGRFSSTHRIFDSQDGVTWVWRQSGDGILEDMAFGAGTFVGVGGANHRSQDGNTYSSLILQSSELPTPKLVLRISKEDSSVRIELDFNWTIPRTTGVRVQRSTNLRDWHAWEVFSVGNPYPMDDTADTKYRFYRAVTP
jgi:hypothetical protein